MGRDNRLLSNRRATDLLNGMLAAWGESQNLIEWSEKFLTTEEKDSPGVRQLVIELAYDLQAGSYVANAKANPEIKRLWCEQAASIIDTLDVKGSLLEVGVGEGTTLSWTVSNLRNQPPLILGFDISFSRLLVAKHYLKGLKAPFRLFCADLLNIPLASDSVELVYSSHSLEPNRGSESLAISEMLRVSSRYVVLLEPIYELASPEAQERMNKHGYVTGLREAAEELGAKVLRYELLPFSGNPLNPSGLVLLEKQPGVSETSLEATGGNQTETCYVCPLTGASLSHLGGALLSTATGVSYPVVENLPLLHERHRLFANAGWLGSEFNFEHHE